MSNEYENVVLPKVKRNATQLFAVKVYLGC